ncbi:MAG: hypothetical protein BJ554DRAFT_652 [Olpidium bornovanus]|uniref:Uncharacterized protein n=1 Tax=Olpidium bornovanus TaxID=278681 RepID=A0A8H8DI13_9FUNG|nr:MAG: hypothetical protein BJ554DRAFT_652 [Olpidium bornovanus]
MQSRSEAVQAGPRPESALICVPGLRLRRAVPARARCAAAVRHSAFGGPLLPLPAAPQIQGFRPYMPVREVPVGNPKLI